ncbi:putative ribonuclease H-like domain-containing protein [Tanacetum coccineum]
MSCFSKLAQSTIKRPYQSRTALTNKNFNQKVNTTKEKVYTVKPKAVNTARSTSAVVNAVRANLVNDVKASTCWVHSQKEDQGYVDSRCSRHMTCNMSYLSDFKEFDGGYVTFGGGARRGRFTGKGTLKTGNLIMRMVQGVLLKVPRKNNIYSVDMRNIVPIESLTCLIHLGFLLASKDETSGILKNFVTEIENLVDKKVKIIRCDNGTEFKNRVMNEFCEKKGIKINRVIIVKPHNKTTYELFRGRSPALSFMRPFRCHVTIRNTLDHLGKFDGKSDDGFFVGYSLTSKAFRVYNIRTRKVEENLRIRFLENKPIVLGDGPKWLFDIGSLTKSMNYVPVVVGTNSNDFLCLEECNGVGHTSKETEFSQDYIVMPLWKYGSMFDSSSKNSSDDEPQPSSNAKKKDDKEEPKRITKALSDPALVEATQEELLQFKLQKGYTQEEGIDYDEVFALVARIEAIRLFLAYASFMGFMVYQMDVKSAFLYGTIEEEVYVCQPLGFEDPDYPDKVYKVVKALYGLHQALRAWYGTLAKYLLDNGFQRGKIDQTLFIKKQKGDILLMSSIGELNFFLGLQVKQTEDGIFISQDKYVAEILKKFGFTYVKTASTPMDTEKPLLKDSDGDDVDVHLYKSMIRSLMYLTSSKPDILLLYLKGQPNMGLSYPRNSPFDLVAYSDSDYAGASLNRKSTIGGCQFLGCRLISWQCKKQTVVATSSTEAEYVKHIEYLMLNASPLKHVKRGRDTKIPQSSGPPVKVGDEAVHKELGDRMERAATTASSLEAE